MSNLIYLQRAVIASGLGVGYFIYRKFLSITMINQNMLLNQQQATELRMQNYTYGPQSTIVAGHQANRMLNDKEKVIVIGAGIIGLATALKLLRENYNVILVDRNSNISTETSYYNGCAYVPYSSKSMISPSNMWLLIKNMFKTPEQTSLRLNWNAFLEKYFTLWGINALLLGGTEAKALANSEKQLIIGKVNEQEVKKLQLETPILNGQLDAQGFLGFFDSEQKHQEMRFALDYHKLSYNNNCELSDQYSKTILSKFPYIINFQVGNRMSTLDVSQRILDYCLTQYPDSFIFLNSTYIKGFALDPKSNVVAAMSNKGILFGDKFVISMAHQTKFLTDKLGLRFPIMPVKGWVLGVNDPPKNTLLTNYVFYTPNYYCTFINNQLRLSGCSEIGLYQQSDNPGEEWGAKHLLNKFNEHFEQDIKMEDVYVRSCFRPITPDDLPVISQIPNFKNIFINTGHGSKGTSYCFGSAEILHSIMKGENKYNQYSIQRYYLL